MLELFVTMFLICFILLSHAVPDLPIGSIGWNRGPPAKVCIIFNTVIGLSHLCCHNVMYFLNNPSIIFLTQLHSISEYSRILNTLHQASLPLLKLIKHTSIFLQSWRWGIGRGLTSGLAQGLSLSKSGTEVMFNIQEIIRYMYMFCVLLYNIHLFTWYIFMYHNNFHILINDLSQFRYIFFYRFSKTLYTYLCDIHKHKTKHDISTNKYKLIYVTVNSLIDANINYLH